MKVRTRNSVYEIELGTRRFRRVEGRRSRSAPPLSMWQRFGQIGPVRVGEPVRIYWMKERAGRMIRSGLWTTAPVLEILDEGTGDNHVDRTFQPMLDGSEQPDDDRPHSPQ